MKKIFLLIALLSLTSLCHGQNESESKDPEYFFTSKYLDNNNPTSYIVEETTFAITSTSFMVSSKSKSKAYKIVSKKSNEWGTIVYNTSDDEGNIYKWSIGHKSLGDVFVKCEADGVDIIYFQ